MNAPPDFIDQQKALACIHCGLCLSSCPTYLETGNENDSPRGRIYLMRSVNEGNPLSSGVVKHLDLCLGCRACEAACPSGVQYGDLLEHAREGIENRVQRSPWQRFLRHVVIEKIFPFPARMRLALFPARLAQKSGIARWFPRFAREAIDLLPAAMRPGKLPVMSEGEAAPNVRRPRVGMIRGCVMNILFGETNENTIALLKAAGCDVWVPNEQGCCGALFAHNGNLEAAREAAKRNIEAFEAGPVDAIIINAAGCGSTLKEYGKLLEQEPDWAERGRKFSAHVKDLVEWLDPEDFGPAPSASGLVTYHDACHLAHAQRITREPREFVTRVAGKNFVALPESDVCCGSAGSYNLTEPAMARRLQDRKTRNIIRSGAKTVVTTNPGCLLQIQAGLKRAGAVDIEVIHIADFLRRQKRSEIARG